MQTFFINANSTLPELRMHLIENTYTTYFKMHEAVQDAEIYFTMVNKDTGIVKIANAKGHIELSERSGCQEVYDVCYAWKKRDTNEKGTYMGRFDIVFNGDITSPDYTYPEGNLVMPIREDLEIVVK